MIKRTSLLLAAALTFSASCRAADYHAVIESLEPYSNLAAFPYLHGNAKIGSMSAGVRPSDIVLTIHARSGDIALRGGPDGLIEIPIDAALRAENPEIEFNQPKGTVALSPAIRVSAPPRTQFSYRLYWDMAGQYLDWQNQRLGLFQRFHAPKPASLIIAFSTDASATIDLPNGPLTMTADAQHRIRIPQKDEWRKTDPQIQLSAMPESILLEAE